ncbi:hypothetical protein H072_1958 [Dactylellina haptotyla CBS 200.50]|uniref:Short-chain dehydrogenase/reductase 3 n=1 Tax=Dactylellina haptotyla (strain CBS 200.50) TaxID=1284197 RepID=S8C8T4_DACHA|nr:hypothetical protein H072_1958 [Dactylellina haptotyla CBS 200.50]
MAPKQSIIPREGFVMDAVLNIVKKFALNPKYTLPLFLFLRYTRKGQDLSADHQTVFRTIQKFLLWGVLYKVNGYLNWGARNNWVQDNSWVWEKEVALVTGGSGGIGGLVVRGLAEKGIKVVVLDVIDLTFDAPKNVYFYKCDITSTSKLAEVAEEIRINVGNPTIIVNNAGVARGNTILDATEKDIRFTFDVNILAHFWVLKEFMPYIIKQNHGHIVTVASVAGYQAAPQMVDYAATKAAGISFHEGLTLELKHRYNAKKVRTTLVTQGLTRTPLFVGFGNDSPFLFPPQFPESVAEGIVNQILSGESEHLLFPKSYNMLPGMRGQPIWFQTYVADATKGLMSNWKGRQVIDPNKESKGSEEVAEDVSKSGVLV